MSKIAFIFPGQGSQEVGMLSGLIDNPVVINTLKKASDIIGIDILDLIKIGPVEVLNKTYNTQPVLLATSVALWRLWCETKNTLPDVVAGHSLGEYSALVCAGVISFEAALGLVKNRGHYMQEAVPEGTGAMAAVIGLDDKKVIEICNDLAVEYNGVLSAVNFNAPGQVVVAGSQSLVEQSVAIFKDSGARKVVLLPVSVPSHCELMKPAADKLERDLEGVVFKRPEIAVIQNVTAEKTVDPEAIKDNLTKQLYSPVKWTESIERMAAMGIGNFYECGPGKVLTGLNKRIFKEAATFSLGMVSDFDEADIR